MPGIDNFSQQVQGGADTRPQHELPLLMRMGSMNPFHFSPKHLAAINANRFTTTMFEGGFLDVSAGATGKRAAVKSFLGKRTGAYSGYSMQDNSAYALGRSLRQNMPSWTGKWGQNFQKGGRKIKAQAVNNLNPFSLRRFDSVARLAGDASDASTYTPFQFTSFVAERGFANKGRLGATLRSRFANDFDATTGELLPGKTLYTGGVFGRIQTMGKVLDYEKDVKAFQALGPRNPASYTRAEARIAKRAEKAASKLAKFDENVVRLGMQTDAPFINAAVADATSRNEYC
ncbi:MAG: hypothetical protein RLZZ196_780 [Bacteroidota bacterium]|jgi:hypothetical protein